MKATKTIPLDTSVTEFIASIKDERRRDDSEALLAILQTITKLKPVMWGSSIVGFGTYHYKYVTGREGDAAIIGFAPRKAALVLYGVIYYDQNFELSKQLGSHTAGKGCLYIKDLSKINLEILEKMIREAYTNRDAHQEPTRTSL